MHPYFGVGLPHLFAHRGASGVAPENTLIAFEHAWARGIRFLETDCHATEDGEVVLCHDASLERTTDGEGPIREHRYSELCRLDAGYRFTLDGRTFPFRGTGTRVPRLVDLLERFPMAHINLEVKQADPPIAEEVVRIVRAAGATERVLLAAEDGCILDAIRALDPGTALGSSREDVIEFFGALDGGLLDGLEPRSHALQLPRRAVGRDLVTRELIAAAERLGLYVHVWTVNDPVEMRELLDIGAHGLMSDHPDRLLAAARAA